MTGCIYPCRCETESQDPETSPGPVADDECLCRSAFDPNHLKKGKFANSFAPRSHLAKGQLFVYRVSERAIFNRGQVVDQIKATGQADNQLAAVFQAAAERI
jgi:hypothetical protein